MAERTTPLAAPEVIRMRGPYEYVNDITAASCFCGPDEVYGPVVPPEPYRFPEQPPSVELPSPFIERKKRWWRR